MFDELARLDLRGAFDLAVMIEEDAEAGYERLGALLGDDPGGAGDVFRAMARNEAKHRAELQAYRAAVFRADPPRIELSVLDGTAERPDLEEEPLPGTAREALLHALAAERRSFEFYRDALQRVADPAAAYLFRQLMEEETEHVALLTARLATCGAVEDAAPPRRARGATGPRREAADDRELDAVLPRFDAATQAVVRRVLLHGDRQEDVAAALGVSRRTVARKLERFLAVARAEAGPGGTRSGREAAADEPHAPRPND